MLEKYIKERLQEKEILLMTHIVIGYPSFEESFKIVETMVKAGVDLMELQIPFSEPVADGPVILHANQESLKAGSTVAKCIEFAEKAASSFDIPFLFMSYYNILFKYGVDRFVGMMKDKGLKGAIVPDVPHEEGDEYLGAMHDQGLDPVFLYSPTTSDARMKEMADLASGFIYCVARKGVTGANTSFSQDLDAYLKRCRAATDLPLALGFGIKEKQDVDYLRGKAEIAVIGTQSIKIVQEQGVAGLEDFLTGLR